MTMTITIAGRFIKRLVRQFETQAVARNLNFPPTLTETVQKEISANFSVQENFLSEAEEESLLREVEPYMKRLRYEYDHWDNAIHGYKETERLNWTSENAQILERVRKTAFPSGASTLPHVHVLDLNHDGYIKPHIDSVRFCGDVIAGLSLLSDSVMRLTRDSDKFSFDALLKRRSLYIMKNSIRYDFAHEILPTDKSFFNGTQIVKKRRISIICRSEADPEKME